MHGSKGVRFLAIGLDAADPEFIHDLIERGELPRLKALRDQGMWGQVESPAGIGSGAVWPTFMTGADPDEHGIYSSRPWNAETMQLSRLATDGLRPFWERLAAGGCRTAVLDVPFMPVLGLRDGIEIAEWGAHDKLTGEISVSPSGFERWVADNGGVHPFAASSTPPKGPRDLKGLAQLSASCLAGARQRGELASRLMSRQEFDLAIIGFSELHHASHYLWHTLDPGPSQSQPRNHRESDGTPSPLVDLCRESDRQIGRLVDIAGSECTVLVFSLHGMRRSYGVPGVLDAVLQSQGFLFPEGLGSRSLSARARRALKQSKAWMPPVLRGAVRSRTPARLAQLTRPADMPPYDWSRTTAFPVPTDQHGWIRVNLIGRERQGIVDPQDYGTACTRLEEVLRGLSTIDGSPVVDEVIRTAGPTMTPPQDLPDLVVHWNELEGADPLKIRAPAVSVPRIGAKFTGEHSPHGFFMLRPGIADAPRLDERVHARDLAGFIGSVVIASAASNAAGSR